MKAAEAAELSTAQVTFKTLFASNNAEFRAIINDLSFSSCSLFLVVL